jgi:hypothetical protein
MRSRKSLAGKLAVVLGVLAVSFVGSSSASASVRCHRFEPNQPCLGSIVSEDLAT